jgi:hypothetical protein
MKDGFVFINRIIGNELMFDRKKDFPFVLRKESRMQIYKAINFNMQGSLMLANKMFTANKIILHSVCEETTRQWERWAIQNNQPEKGFPLCETLLTVISELKEQGEMKEPEELKPYGQKKKKIHDGLYNKEYEKMFSIKTSKARNNSSEYTF